jgi:pimeloyl-ACP methyl ester carboxylesterase
MISKKVLFKNSILHYKISETKGKYVMLVHGFGEDWRVWGNQIDALSKHYNLILPDIFGSGDSDILEGENITIDDYAEGLKEIITAESIKQFSIFGHSMGGYIALAYLAQFPEELSSIGLIHSTAYADDEIKIEIRNKSIQFIHEFGSMAFLKTSVSKLFSLHTYNKIIIDAFLQMGSNISKNTLIQYYHAIKIRPDRIDLLKNATIPVLFISGMDDTLVNYSDNIRQSILPNISEIKLLANTAHIGFYENSDLSNDVILLFLQNHIAC